MHHHIAHLISLGRSGNQPDMVTAEKILALPEISLALALCKADELRAEVVRGDKLCVFGKPPKA